MHVAALVKRSQRNMESTIDVFGGRCGVKRIKNNVTLMSQRLDDFAQTTRPRGRAFFAGLIHTEKFALCGIACYRIKQRCLDGHPMSARFIIILVQIMRQSAGKVWERFGAMDYNHAWVPRQIGLSIQQPVMELRQCAGVRHGGKMREIGCFLLRAGSRRLRVFSQVVFSFPIPLLRLLLCSITIMLMNRCTLSSLLFLGMIFFANAADTTRDEYIILTWKKTKAQPSWNGVIEALIKKHRATVVVCDQDLRDSLPVLQKHHPRYVAVVGSHEQVGGRFINGFHQLMRQIDEDPYTDARWGVITGRKAEDAMKIVNEVKPLEIRHTVSGTRIATRMCEEAECFDELLPRGHSLKKANETEKEIPLDDADSIAELATAFSHPSTQLIITSGHATTRDWQPGFRYKNGSFHSRDGVIYGRDLQGKEHRVQQDTPKVYLPCGNCLMGLIDGADAMALAWMHSAGVRQMAGYVEPTWYGYMGWGLIDYFVEQPGRYTFAEAFLANQMALVHRLETVSNLTPMDRKGLLFDRDMVAFYGDPAWSATMAARSLPFSQILTQTEKSIVIEILPLEGEKSYEAVDTNGSQRGGRPFIAFLSKRINPSTFHLKDGADALLGDDFVLVPRPATGTPARPMRIEWILR